MEVVIISIIKPSFLTTLTLLILLQTPITSSSKIPKSYTNFIKKSCNTTTYPSLCTTTLTRYAAAVKTNQLKLCSAALTAAIQSARACSVTASALAQRREIVISRPVALAVKDCIADLKDAVYELKLTVGAMGRLRGGRRDREVQWANAKTYASAAITDAETCVDGFLGRRVDRRVKSAIKGCISDVEKRVSIVLSLINRLF